ncbi:hypothetical protein SDJN03_29424, partial [Cucurbita argyrosperma subsp. sororia]
METGGAGLTENLPHSIALRLARFQTKTQMDSIARNLDGRSSSCASTSEPREAPIRLQEWRESIDAQMSFGGNGSSFSNNPNRPGGESSMHTIGYWLLWRHKLWSQPSWDHTSTAAAAASLLFEIQLVSQLN